MTTTPLPTPQIGDFIESRMVTDSTVYEIVKVTPSTITIRTTKDTSYTDTENRSGNPYPCVWQGVAADPTGKKTVVRLRKDGTYRVDSWTALRPAAVRDGNPCRFTDYRI